MQQLLHQGLGGRLPVVNHSVQLVCYEQLQRGAGRQARVVHRRHAKSAGQAAATTAQVSPGQHTWAASSTMDAIPTCAAAGSARVSAVGTGPGPVSPKVSHLLSSEAGLQLPEALQLISKGWQHAPPLPPAAPRLLQQHRCTEEKFSKTVCRG
jgi:hypothetical protein